MNALADLFDLMAIVGVGLLLGVVAVVSVLAVRERKATNARRIGMRS